eukprot:11188925-Lingulodinium_polyedra.AAC.1
MSCVGGKQAVQVQSAKYRSGISCARSNKWLSIELQMYQPCTVVWATCIRVCQLRFRAPVSNLEHVPTLS